MAEKNEKKHEEEEKEEVTKDDAEEDGKEQEKDATSEEEQEQEGEIEDEVSAEETEEDSLRKRKWSFFIWSHVALNETLDFLIPAQGNDIYPKTSAFTPSLCQNIDISLFSQAFLRDVDRVVKLSFSCTFS